MKKIALLLGASWGILACSKSVSGGVEKPGGSTCTSKDSAACASKICTAEFRTLTIAIRDAGGSPVVLDSAFTTDTFGNRLPEGAGSTPAQEGNYAVLTDSWVAGHWNTTCRVQFKGYKAGRLVVSEFYEVHTDCCHIERTAGATTVVIQD